MTIISCIPYLFSSLLVKDNDDDILIWYGPYDMGHITWQMIWAIWCDVFWNCASQKMTSYDMLLVTLITLDLMGLNLLQYTG